jgi:myo-inositol-1(or 4)-monophosphatase
MNEDLSLLKAAILDAGAVALRMRTGGLKVEHKPGGSPVTNADRAVDDMLAAHLRSARPGYGWLSEESPDTLERLQRRRVFMIDPIDGTSAYIKGKDWWSLCGAVVEDGRPIAGVVFAPALNEVYEAALGEGAQLNGRPIQVTRTCSLTGCAMLGDAKMFAHPSWPRPWPDMAIEQRNSVAYRMALVAAGAFDACVAMAPKNDWDIAAADLIAHEAGARVTDHLNRAFIYNRPDARQRSLVCAGPALHSLLLERLGHIQD